MEIKTNNNAGFTLIELLVVIAIIGILASVISLSVQSARVKARDAKRLGDMKQFSTALEQYHITHGSYPTGTLSMASAGPGVELNSSGALDGASEQFIPNYVPLIPETPKPADGDCQDVSGAGNNNYWYEVADDATFYTLTFCLGGETGQLSKGVHYFNPNGSQ